VVKMFYPYALWRRLSGPQGTSEWLSRREKSLVLIEVLFMCNTPTVPSDGTLMVKVKI
jgi:hypothetical protein